MDTVYRGRVFSVEAGRMRLPNGREHDLAIVRHPPSVVLIPMVDETHVFLIRQFRPSVNRDLWELPAGSLEPGESAVDAARRECEEELGLVPERLVQIRALFPAPGFCDEALIFFRALDLRAPAADSTHKPDEDEDIYREVFSVAEAHAMVARGDVIDLKTAYGLTLI